VRGGASFLWGGSHYRAQRIDNTINYDCDYDTDCNTLMIIPNTWYVGRFRAQRDQEIGYCLKRLYIKVIYLITKSIVTPTAQPLLSLIYYYKMIHCMYCTTV